MSIPTPSKETQDKAAQLGRVIDGPAHTASQVTQGKIPGHPDKDMGHPIHPATVHWPIAFLSTTFTASALTTLPPSYFRYISAVLPPQATLPAIAHYSAAAAVLTAVPAIVTGIGEGYELVRAQYLQKGTWGKVFDDAWNMRDEGGKKVKMTITHASMNDAVVALAGYHWYHGWRYPNTSLPMTANVLGMLALPALFYSAMLGGKLVYEYAVGVQRQGPSLEVKAEQEQKKSQ